MNKYLKLFFLVLIGINLVLCSWYVLHKDIYFQTDIARDFLLLQEVDQKKIVLIGPRSSVSGLFHGPLWMYINYPAYVVGQGNPIVVGWYWIVLIAVFLFTSFLIAKKLFDEMTAYLYVTFLSLLTVFEARALFNPHGAFFLLPAFLFFFVKALKTVKLKFILIFLFIAGCIIQFQMAIGIPLLLLSIVPLAVTIFKKKRKKYFFAFFILLLPLSTFIIFDLKHQFIQFHTVLHYVFNSSFDKHTYGNIFGLITNRIEFFTGIGLGIFKDESMFKNQLIFIFLAVVIYQQIKTKKYSLVYKSAVYFYGGYYLLSLINIGGGMLYHYLMPLFSLTVLIFTSLVTSKFKKIFVIIFIIAYLANFMSARDFIGTANGFFGNDQNSWKFLSTMAQKVYAGTDNGFGYFIYMPDAYAYQPKYAMVYAARQSTKRSYYFQKKTITYLVIAPPPPNIPEMHDSWWTINQVKISNHPVKRLLFPNGYKIEKYSLTPAEMAIPFTPSIDTGIHFR